MKMEKLDCGKRKDIGMNKFRKTTPAENQIILDWINQEYWTNYNSIQELLDEDYDELAEYMFFCAMYGINRILHYDNHNIYIEIL